jgi:transposase
MLTLDGLEAVGQSRSVGAFLGLRPKQSQSDDSDPEHHISKTGNIYLRYPSSADRSPVMIEPANPTTAKPQPNRH